MEAVNNANTGSLVALHTTAGCTMENVQRRMTGTPGQGNCHNEINYNTGCTVTGPPATYGPEFNAAGGGIVALEWRDEGIRAWVFGRGQDQGQGLTALPAAGGERAAPGAVPDPSTWGPPLADFPNTSCDVGRHFRNQSIVVNIDLCGPLAKATYASSGCPSTCEDFVANNPSAFANAYWEFGAFQVYRAL
ncbi:hypothetical protein MMYC01_207865 [Madurella mycetomatis]|nr:hypothetical protein MMYC01_207865 [Madurella mycetomatis]